MIDDDGYDGIRSHGVDPDWNPFSTPRDDDPDDIGLATVCWTGS